MSMLADTVDAVIGVDTHTDTHTACMLDHLGRQISAITIPADPGGCRVLLAWAQRNTPGPRLAWAVEGTRSHGLGLARMLQAEGHAVVEANRPARASKRPGGSPPPPRNQGLPDPATCRAENRPRNPPLPQALRRPPTIPPHGGLSHLTTHRSVNRSQSVAHQVSLGALHSFTVLSD